MPSASYVQRRHGSYTVAFICALNLEMSAARYLLDSEHQSLPPQPGDSNLYILGELSGYNVVLAWLSGSQGKGAAATVATNLNRSFPAIAWRFLVGIGGGVPSDQHDIRLGDVVISMPDGQHGGVVQYDLGKDEEEGFKLKGFLLPPPTQVRNAVDLMRSNHLISENKIEEFLSQMLQKGRRLSIYRRPSPEEDVLFAIDYPHDTNRFTCESCDREKVVSRQPRSVDGPEIHYGLIASGDRVMRSAAKRQATVHSVGDILCFEMEAAGIATEYSCITIRGIADYSDSHKNDRWQYYAAAAAAATAKELLSCIPGGVNQQTWADGSSAAVLTHNESPHTGKTQRASRPRLESAEPHYTSEATSQSDVTWLSVSPTDSDLVALQLSKDCAKSLAFKEMDNRINDPSIISGDGTCRWLLQHKVCADWSTQDRALLWIKGKPGSGKSTLLRHFLGIIWKATESGSTKLILSFFFHRRGVELEQTPLGLFRSLLHQLLGQIPETQLGLCRTFKKRCDTMGEPGKDWHWNLHELQRFFRDAISNILEHRTVWLFVDALDECGKQNAIELIRFFNQLLISLPPRRSQFLICVTCRHYPVLDLGSAYEITVEDENEKDIFTYVRDQLSLLDAEAASSMTDLITTRADGIFMWASLQTARVRDLELAGANLAKIEATISSTPQGLHNLYLELIQSMSERQKCLKLIQWICFATRPLTLDELRWALAIDSDHTSPIKSLKQVEDSEEFTADSERMERRLKTLSCGLVEAVSSSNQRVARFIHQSVYDFFVKRGITFLDDSLGTSEKGSNCEIGLAHYRISRTCIRYITMEEVAQSTAQREGLVSQFPLLRYAAASWMHHAKESENRDIAQDDLLIYFNWPSPACLQVWLRTMSRIEYFLEGSPYVMTRMLHVLPQYGLVSPLRRILCADEVDLELNARDSYGRTPLLWAALKGNANVVELLLNTEKVEVNARDGSNRTPILWATYNGHQAVVMLLIASNKAEIDAKSASGRTALSLAAERGQISMVKTLITANRESIDLADNDDRTPLWYAVHASRLEVAEILIQQGAKVAVAGHGNGNDWTALHVVSYRGQAEIIKLMNECYVDIGSAVSDGLAPLDPATKSRNFEYVKLFFERRANAEEAKRKDRTPSMEAATAGWNDIPEFLLEGTDELEARTNDDGCIALVFACRSDNIKAVEALIKKGADIAALNNIGITPAKVTCLTQGFKYIKILLEKRGSRFETENEMGDTPLHFACWVDSAQIVRLW